MPKPSSVLPVRPTGPEARPGARDHASSAVPRRLPRGGRPAGARSLPTQAAREAGWSREPETAEDDLMRRVFVASASQRYRLDRDATTVPPTEAA